MNIGQAAKESGLSERMIRYFEKQGLIPAPARKGSGYRSYGDDDVRRMRLIALAQDVGFTTEVISQLLAVIDGHRDDASPVSAAERMLVLAELDRKAGALDDLRASIDGPTVILRRHAAGPVDAAVDASPAGKRSQTREFQTAD